MNRTLLFLFFLFAYSHILPAQEQIVVIHTTLGTMKARLYPDVPNHTATFVNRVKRGDFNGTLFTRVIPEFMIQGGSPDSRNAPTGARVGYGDRNTEIMPEFRPHYFSKKGALAAPRQHDDINPQKKSDMSQFFIVQGKVYRSGELDTLQRVKNQPFRKKAVEEFYYPIQEELKRLREEDPREYNRLAAEVSHKMDSVIRSYPDHLLFTEEQKEVYTTIGGSHHLDGEYTIFGELTEGFDVLDKIASQARDGYDRPKQDVKIITMSIETN